MTIVVECSDRGQHAPTVLCHLRDVGGAVTVAERPQYAGLPQSGPAPGHTWQSHVRTFPTYLAFYCPRCRREHRITHARLRKLYDGLIASGRQRVDASHLR